MSAPRLEIHLDRIRHNAEVLVGRLAPLGISVTAVTKSTLGSPEVARVLVAAGATAIGESRIENVETLRAAGIVEPITLIRSPMLSQVDRVVTHVDLSLNTEPEVLAALAAAARRRGTTHAVLLMVELGDLREGILARDVEAVARQVLALPSLVLRGIGANLACQHGIAPDARNMAELSDLASALEASLGVSLEVVSGGNSANLGWISGAGACGVGRINDLRLGEAVLLGRNPLDRRPIDGLRTDCFGLVAEVIEAKVKPSRPWGDVHQAAFGTTTTPVATGSGDRIIVALGRQDVDPDGVSPPHGLEVLGASSDHLVLGSTGRGPEVGVELEFAVDGYGALVRAMTSPFIGRVFV